VKTPVNYIILLGLFLFSTHNIYGQSGLCDSNTPFYNVDLSSNPDSIWISPPDVREGNCCALIATFRYDHKKLSLAFSYDFTLSKLTVANKAQGGAELSLIYLVDIKTKKRPNKQVYCPKF